MKLVLGCAVDDFISPAPHIADIIGGAGIGRPEDDAPGPWPKRHDFQRFMTGLVGHINWRIELNDLAGFKFWLFRILLAKGK